MNGNHLEPTGKPFPTREKPSQQSKQGAVVARLSSQLRQRACALSVAGVVVCACGAVSLILAITVVTLSLSDAVSSFVSHEFAYVRASVLVNEVALESLIANARDSRDGLPVVIENVARTIHATEH